MRSRFLGYLRLLRWVFILTSSDNPVYRTKSDIRYRVIDDEAVVVRQTDAEVLVINEVGARVLALLDGKTELAAVMATIESEFDVAPDQLQQDVRAFVEEIRGAGVIEEVGG